MLILIADTKALSGPTWWINIENEAIMLCRTCWCRLSTSSSHSHQLLVASLLGMRNCAQQQATHEAEILGTELVTIVQVEYVLLANTALDRCWHFYHRAWLCHAARCQSSHHRYVNRHLFKWPPHSHHIMLGISDLQMWRPWPLLLFSACQRPE